MSALSGWETHYGTKGEGRPGPNMPFGGWLAAFIRQGIVRENRSRVNRTPGGHADGKLSIMLLEDRFVTATGARREDEGSGALLRDASAPGHHHIPTASRKLRDGPCSRGRGRPTAVPHTTATRRWFHPLSFGNSSPPLFPCSPSPLPRAGPPRANGRAFFSREATSCPHPACHCHGAVVSCIPGSVLVGSASPQAQDDNRPASRNRMDGCSTHPFCFGSDSPPPSGGGAGVGVYLVHPSRLKHIIP
jgi:hypothetical protein